MRMSLLNPSRRVRFAIVSALLFLLAASANAGRAADLRAELNETGDEIRILRSGQTTPLVTQAARPDFRPYLHPLHAPDGRGVLTELASDQHPHQTGLSWGL
ncbi:MAG: PmoA family protein, partial [Planctomycetaceae bacterium]|nr:PmoA family protein [Planctomycetaceae bacterium]